MDDWQRKLARDIVAETPAGKLEDREATLEIAFGDARAAVTYALELARAHRLPAAGSVIGDHLWMRLGDGRVRLTLNRRAATVETDVTLGSPETERKLVRWQEGGGLVDDGGSPADLGDVARAGIDALLAGWKARPAGEKKLSSAPPPDLEDTPTRG
jgi:hypothetical protein